jgi:hypothetical protein
LDLGLSLKASVLDFELSRPTRRAPFLDSPAISRQAQNQVYHEDYQAFHDSNSPQVAIAPRYFSLAHLRPSRFSG